MFLDAVTGGASSPAVGSDDFWVMLPPYSNLRFGLRLTFKVFVLFCFGF